MTTRTKYKIASHAKYVKHIIGKTIRTINGTYPRCKDCMFIALCGTEKDNKICEGFLD